MIQRIWKNISLSGVSEHVTSQDKADIVLVNRLVFISLIITVLYSPFVFYFEMKMLYIPFVATFMFLLYLFYLTRKKRPQLASVLLIIMASVNIFYFSIQIPGTIHLFTIPVFIYNLTLVKNKYFKIANGALLVLIFFAGEYHEYLFGSDKTGQESMKDTFFILNNIVVFLCCIFTLFHLKITNIEYEKDIIKQKVQLEDQHSELTRVHSDIKSSITYAKRIQTAIIPPEKVIKSYLENSFILYKPKDIVASDFYWSKIIDDRILYAVADCSGQGVPGAMISVVCHNALNRSIGEFKLKTPSEILEKSREIIISAFEVSGSNMMDGMDIALVSIPLNIRQIKNENNTILFSGANIPLYLIRDGRTVIVPADKQPVGRYHSQTQFNMREIDIKKEDMIYISTNGYTNQTGGDLEEKIKKEAFLQLLSSIGHLSPEIQRHNLIKSFESWKGNRNQTDDLCMIGLKV